MIPLIITLVVIGSIFTAYAVIKHKLQSITQELYGTSSLSEANARMKEEYASTPKSVSAMTSLYLPKIVRNFPDFIYSEMKSRSQNVLTQYLAAIHAENPSLMTEGTDELQDKVKTHIAMLNENGKHEHFENVRIHRTEISNYRKSSGRCVITFQTACEYLHYITDTSGNLVSGDKNLRHQSRYDIEMAYIQDREIVEQTTDNGIGLKCPFCDAPLTNLGSKHCEYCGSPVQELNIKVWNFINITERV